jgi:Protein of unknown function (DUF2612)
MATIQEFDYSVNILKSVLWQYNEAPNLLSLLTQKQEWYNLFQTDFWSSWYTDVFNLQTANLFGLAVWSIILNVPLYVPYEPEPDDKPIWGFNDNSLYPTLENTYTNFFGGNFSSRGDVIILTEEEQRFLLRLRYYQLVTRGEVWDINKFLNYLVNSSNIGFTGQMYALDGLDTSMRYVTTDGTFPDALLDVLLRLDILPRPAGVLIDGVVINDGITWGFNNNDDYPVLENTYVNFEQGNFFDGFFKTF